MAYNDEGGAGIGGWLAFFVLVMAIFTPAVMVVTPAAALYGDSSTAAAYGANWPTIEAFEWAMAVIVVAGCWYIVWRLNKVQVWQTVRVTIAGIWLIGVGSAAADFIGLSLISGVPIGDLVQAAGPEIARPFIFAILWTAYFLRSRRVANTYPRDGDPNEVAEVFG